jgi:hypothetical protein
MARIKTFFGCSDLKTGGVIIGYISAFASLIYLLIDIELVLLIALGPSSDRKRLFGEELDKLNKESIAFPITLFSVVASLYGVFSSLYLVCGALCVSSNCILDLSSPS